MYKLLTASFFFFLTIVIASSNSMAKETMTPEEGKRWLKIGEELLKDGGPLSEKALSTSALFKDVEKIANASNRELGFGDAVGGPAIHSSFDHIAVGGKVQNVRDPRIHLTKEACLSGIKRFISDRNARTLWANIEDKSFNYSYNSKTKEYVPVFMKIKGNSVTVVGPKGTVRTSGRNCFSDGGRTSYQILSELMIKSNSDADAARKLAKTVPSRDKTAYRSYVRKIEKKRKRMLENCADSGLKNISQSASRALTLAGYRGGKPYRKQRKNNKATR